MAFGATYTLTVNAIAKVMNKINQDGYGCEYMLRTSTEEYRLKIRHASETVKNPNPLTRGMDRHTATFSHRIFATATVPEYYRECTGTYRVMPGDDLTSHGYFMDACNTAFANNSMEADLVNWVS